MEFDSVYEGGFWRRQEVERDYRVQRAKRRWLNDIQRWKQKDFRANEKESIHMLTCWGGKKGLLGFYTT